MSTKLPPPLVVRPTGEHSATVIFAHGLGDTGYGWEPVAEMLKVDPKLAHIKWILPHAPAIPITANGGMKMPGWFDIASLDFNPNEKPVEDEEGMLKTRDALGQLIAAEVDAGVPADRIVLGGFSQGGAMTLLTGLTTERRLAGLAVLSGWAPITDRLKKGVSEYAKTLPIFWGHGKGDPLVKYAYAIRSIRFLQEELGIPVATPGQSKGLEFHGYEGLQHSVAPEELEALKQWLKIVIPQKL